METLKEELATLKERQEELENCDNEQEYNDMLDECGIDASVYAPSRILQELDPIAYNCGHTDYNDSLLSEVNDEIESKEQEIKDEQTIK